jgi:hypothetical protein
LTVEISKDQIVDWMMGFFKTKAVTSALELDIFDALADGPTTAPEICAACGLPEHSGQRLLIALTAMGLLSKEGDIYRNSEVASRYLVSRSPEWMGWLARHIDTFLYPLWSNTSAAIREGKDQRLAVFGDNRSWFEILYQNPSDVADFQEFLGIFAKPFIDGMVQAFDFSRYQKFLDIGSGIGTLPLAVAAHYPTVEIGICELPEAAGFVRERIRSTDHAERIRVISGDVINGDIPGQEYDLIHLGWMLHDYAPEIQARILGHIHDALPPGGAFIASETPLNDGTDGPLFTALLSINMLVSTDGGIESTNTQYLQRLRDTGFINLQVLDIPGPRTLFYGEKAA